jgi:hypothetical protein
MGTKGVMELKDVSTCPSCETQLRITFEPVVGIPMDSPKTCVCGWHSATGEGLAGTISHREYLAPDGQWKKF